MEEDCRFIWILIAIEILKVKFDSVWAFLILIKLILQELTPILLAMNNVYKLYNTIMYIRTNYIQRLQILKSK